MLEYDPDKTPLDGERIHYFTKAQLRKANARAKKEGGCCIDDTVLRELETGLNYPIVHAGWEDGIHYVLVADVIFGNVHQLELRKAALESLPYIVYHEPEFALHS